MSSPNSLIFKFRLVWPKSWFRSTSNLSQILLKSAWPNVDLDFSKLRQLRTSSFSQILKWYPKMLFWFTLAIDQFPTSAFLFPLSLSISPWSKTNNGPLISRSHLIISHTLAIVPDHLYVFQSDQSIQEISRTSDFPPYTFLQTWFLEGLKKTRNYT